MSDLIKRFVEERNQLKQQLAECHNEVHGKINEYASLLARCERADEQLAECRAERDELLAACEAIEAWLGESHTGPALDRVKAAIAKAGP